MNNQLWSWVLSIVGVSGFYFAGKKIWWAWYINVACQILWFTYAFVSHQWGFILGSAVYSWVFIKNSIEWTREHRRQAQYNIDGDYRQAVAEGRQFCTGNDRISPGVPPECGVIVHPHQAYSWDKR